MRGAALIASIALCACAKSGPPGDLSSTPEADAGGFTGGDGGTPTAPVVNGEVFGHSESALFRVDTATRQVVQVGLFQGCTYVADIALDETSTIYASTGTGLYYVETNTARCTLIKEGTFPNSLSFIPAGILDGDHETLVGFQGGDYVKIDPGTGAVITVGQIGEGLESSGDIVSVKDGKTFVTVKGPGCADCLVEIDPATGKLTKNWGPLGHSDVFGLAFWAGELYAFTNFGELLVVALDTGKPVATALAITNRPADLKFWGAGSTTAAPLGSVR